MKTYFAILDGSSLFFRAFYALQLPPNARGVHTNAVHGFAMMLVKLLKEFDPTQVVIAFDKSRTTFRTALYPEYKGTRDKTPEELISQIPLLKELAQALGIPFLELDDYEADDIIGTLATQAAAQGVETVVVTGDRDALQLIRDGLTVVLTKKGISDTRAYDVKMFEEEYGFAPIRLIDMKGLMGDSSDNIPGVPGIGPKTATKLLIEYGTIENVLDHAGEVSGKKLSASLVEYRDQALLSKRLATIECSVPELRYDAEGFRMQPDRAALEAFCREYELRTVGRTFADYLGAAPANTVEQSLFDAEAGTVPSVSYDAAELAAADLDVLRTAQEIAVGAVFSGTAPFVQIMLLAFSYGEEQRILPAGSPYFDEVLALLAERPVVLWNAKRYAQAGVLVGTDVFDLELADYLLRPEESKRDLARAMFAHLGHLPEMPDDLTDAQRALWEAHTAMQLHAPVRQALEEKSLWPLYRDVELPLVPVLTAMEQTGIYVNRMALERELAAANTRIDALIEEIHSLAGTEFNISSPKQLGEILFERLGLTTGGKVKKTKTGYSTNAETLEELRDQHPIVNKVLTYRMWTKLRSTYLEGISALIRPGTGRVHTSFNQTVTATGRLSSSDPNLQNIPVRTEEGRAVRALFEPGEGYDALLSADYSQIELRILAHMSGDETLIDAFRSGQDVHARTASEVFGVPLEEVTGEQRRRAKAVNFGIVYGLSDFGLSRDLGIPRKEAAGYIERYFERYHGVREFLDKTVADARANGYVTTLYGRRRDLPALNSRNFMQRSFAERMAMNTPIQGTAADLIKIAMIRADEALRAAGVKSRILLQVHDELVLETTAAEAEMVSEILRAAMSRAAELAVPLAVDVHMGKNWAEAK
ncbi:DNA-directed DNA polymerase [Selenomonas sp. oral taxon 892 str. F0426]|uniref:DNA polymerase I n=1 Tax=Selenomonas sp. oral taxon 892 TaxID=1321785 RepID=UPI0003AD5A18|nr:DNA polymerase I [Selenomonas sp. oral taxon 892]ERJ95590.1 DNA-directed DNA polymerase [Selenomonas sp. oral taxon 892 str. F0426]